MYILLIITYLGGYAAGPTLSMQEYSSAKSCFIAKEKAMSMIDELLQANLQTYRPISKSASAECVRK
jgi:hypothetical protein